MTLILGLRNNNGITVLSDGLGIEHTPRTGETLRSIDHIKIYKISNAALMGIATNWIDGGLLEDFIATVKAYCQGKPEVEFRKLAKKVAREAEQCTRKNRISHPASSMQVMIAGYDSDKPEIFKVDENYTATQVVVHCAVGQAEVANTILRGRFKEVIATPELAAAEGQLIIKACAQTQKSMDQIQTIGGRIYSWQINPDGIAGPYEMDMVEG